jgi:hypothetical protein
MRIIVLSCVVLSLCSCAMLDNLGYEGTQAITDVGTEVAGTIFGYPGRIVAGTISACILGYFGFRKGKK